MTAADYGFTTPVGSDLLSLGDNAIAANAERTAALFDELRFARPAQSGVDLDTIKRPGSYSLSAPYPSGFTNTPPGNNTASKLLVIGRTGLLWAAQMVFQYGATPRLWWRISASQTTWNPWVEIGAGTSGLPVNALATGGRDMRLQLFRDDYPLVSTGGRGAVVFRYDHGLANFRDVLLPLHQEHGLSAYIAMNSRNWGLSENAVPQSEASAWTDVEWGNHTADHTDKTGIADIYDAIVNGRIELEQQVGKTVHGFTVPGVTEHDKFDGFGTGGASGYSNSYAGALILAHHAIASGTIGASQRVMDGQIRIGGRHYTWESSEWASIKAQIDAAAATKTALTLMAHPRTMNLSGYWTPALAGQVLSYVRQLIDAGDLADISYYQSHHATTAAI